MLERSPECGQNGDKLSRTTKRARIDPPERRVVRHCRSDCGAVEGTADVPDGRVPCFTSVFMEFFIDSTDSRSV